MIENSEKNFNEEACLLNDLEDFINKALQDGWHKKALIKKDQSNSQIRLRERKDLILLVRRTPFERFEELKIGRHSDDGRQSSSNAFAKKAPTKGKNAAGSLETLGGPKAFYDPATGECSNSGRYFNFPNSSDLPEPANFTSYHCLALCRPDNPSLVIAYDSEWKNLPDGSRKMISWQFACIWDRLLYAFFFLNFGVDSLPIEDAIGSILDVLVSDGKSFTEENIKRLDARKFTVYDYCDELDANGHPVVSTTTNILEANAKSIFLSREGNFVPEKITDQPENKRKGKRATRKWSCYNRRLDLSTVKKLPVTILCHAGVVDITALKHDAQNDFFLKRLSEIQGGLVSLEDPISRIIYSPADPEHHYFYPCLFTVRDTICHAPSKKKSLAALGDAVGWPKVELPVGAKEHMLDLLNADPGLFLQYASNDCIVTLLYAAAMYGYNNSPPVTLMSAAAKYSKNVLASVYGVKSEKDFLSKVRLLQKVSKGKVPMKNRPGYIEQTNLEPVNADAEIVLNFAANAYSGGYNMCSEVGYFPFLTHDYDLRSAYPTAMCIIPAVDDKDIIEIEIRHERWTKDTLHKYWNTALGPFRLFFGYIRFRFPDDCPYCCLSVNVDGVPCFPKSSDGLNGVYATGTEVYLALKLGAEIDVDRGFFLNAAYDNEGTLIFPLSTVQKGLVEDRKRAREIDGKNSLTELTLKTMSNSIYGKTSQDVVKKVSWSGRSDDMEDIGPSAITQPIFAAQCTATVRCLLIAAQNELAGFGYKTYSVTTDGLISDAPCELMENLHLYGLASYIRQARSFLTNGEDLRIWDEKHQQTDLINLLTRANVSLDGNGVIAHGGVKTPYDKGSYEDRLFFIDQALTRTGPISFTSCQWTSLKELVHGSDFHIKNITRRVSLDFDMKRKPVKETLSGDHPCFGGKSYDLAHVETEPFESVEEFKRYRSAKKNVPCLRTVDDWEYFFIKMVARSPEAKNIRDRCGIDFNILKSCVIGYRNGLWDIRPLDECKSVQEKLDFINAHNIGRKKFTQSDWKNARRPDRRDSMLPIELLESKLVELQEDTPVADENDGGACITENREKT